MGYTFSDTFTTKVVKITGHEAVLMTVTFGRTIIDTFTTKVVENRALGHAYNRNVW